MLEATSHWCKPQWPGRKSCRLQLDTTNSRLLATVFGLEVPGRPVLFVKGAQPCLGRATFRRPFYPRTDRERGLALQEGHPANTAASVAFQHARC